MTKTYEIDDSVKDSSHQNHQHSTENPKTCITRQRKIPRIWCKFQKSDEQFLNKRGRKSRESENNLESGGSFIKKIPQTPIPTEIKQKRKADDGDGQNSIDDENWGRRRRKARFFSISLSLEKKDQRKIKSRSLSLFHTLSDCNSQTQRSYFRSLQLPIFIFF